MSKATAISVPPEGKKLRIFLSYASAQLTLAQQVDMALTTNGHDVFFDRTDLPPGGAFHTAIHDAIRSSDLFVFLISPESIAKGSYARTELQYAQATWRNPIGRVLPVLAVDTDFAAIPEYLKGGTLLRPDDNLAAEVTKAVNDLAAGSSPHETFAAHTKRIQATATEAARLRQQQTIVELETGWQEETKTYASNKRHGIHVGPTGGFLYILVLYVLYGELQGIGPLLVLFFSLIGAVLGVYMYHQGRRYEKAEAESRDRLHRAASAPILLSPGMHGCGKKAHDCFRLGTQCPTCAAAERQRHQAFHIRSDGVVDQRTSENWLRVFGKAEAPHVSQSGSQQLHTMEVRSDKCVARRCREWDGNARGCSVFLPMRLLCNRLVCRVLRQAPKSVFSTYSKS